MGNCTSRKPLTPLDLDDYLDLNDFFWFDIDPHKVDELLEEVQSEIDLKREFEIMEDIERSKRQAEFMERLERLRDWDM